MAKRFDSKNQMSLFDTLEPPPPPPPPVQIIQVTRQRTMTYYEGLVMQIARDMETLRDPQYNRDLSPDMIQFYQERIESYRKEAAYVLERKRRDALDGDNTERFEREQNEARYG